MTKKKLSKQGEIGKAQIDKIKAGSTFWDETYKSSVIYMLESAYKAEVLRTHGIADIVISGDKALVQWASRAIALTDEELIKKYGRAK